MKGVKRARRRRNSFSLCQATLELKGMGGGEGGRCGIRRRESQKTESVVGEVCGGGRRGTVVEK